MSDQVTVLITGASGGLGHAIVLALAGSGYTLALHIHKHDHRSIELKNELDSINATYKFFAAELREEESIKLLFTAIENELGGIHVLINLAGISFSAISWKQTLADWNNVFSVNVTAAWLLSRYAIPLLRKNSWGRIIYFSSVVAHKPLAGTSAYAASKAALEGLTRAQSTELNRFGITVNCISPGYFNTGMINTVSFEQQKKIIEDIPLSRLGDASELAHWLLYLCDKKSAYTTGQVLQVNGGLHY